jgi:hypothetical protein
MSQEEQPPPPGSMIREESPNPENIKLLAGLVSLTNSELDRLDDNIVDGAHNVYIKAKRFHPETVVQQFIDEGKAAGSYPITGQTARAPAVHHDPERALAASHQQQSQPQPSPAPPPPPSAPQQGHVEFYSMQPQVGNADTTHLSKKMDEILNRLDRIEDTYTIILNLLEKNLHNKIKTITFKLDDNKRS